MFAFVINVKVCTELSAENNIASYLFSPSTMIQSKRGGFLIKNHQRHCFKITLMKSEKIAIKNGTAAENIMLFVILVVACGLRLCTSNQMVAGSDPALETQGPL